MSPPPTSTFCLLRLHTLPSRGCQSIDIAPNFIFEITHPSLTNNHPLVVHQTMALNHSCPIFDVSFSGHSSTASTSSIRTTQSHILSSHAAIIVIVVLFPLTFDSTYLLLHQALHLEHCCRIHLDTETD